jgi:hypothetical protein
MSGASDLSAFDVLASIGARFYVNRDLHAKAFMVDRRLIFLGSANLTRRGLGLANPFNVEFGTFLEPTADDIAVVDAAFAESAEVDATIVLELSEWLRSQVPPPPTQRIAFPEALSTRLIPRVSGLWVAQVMYGSFPALSEGVYRLEPETQLALGLSSNTVPQSSLAASFAVSRGFQWLLQQLNESEDKTCHFGDLSSRLHDALLDDPKPYRADVKDLVSDLLSWSTVLMRNRVVVDRPQHSERIRLVPLS